MGSDSYNIGKYRREATEIAKRLTELETEKRKAQQAAQQMIDSIFDERISAAKKAKDEAVYKADIALAEARMVKYTKKIGLRVTKSVRDPRKSDRWNGEVLMDIFGTLELAHPDTYYPPSTSRWDIPDSGDLFVRLDGKAGRVDKYNLSWKLVE